MKNDGVIIVGAGAAGHAAARTLRAGGWDARITLIDRDEGAPYNRTLVDKAVLPGLLTPSQIALPALTAPGVDLLRGEVLDLKPRSREVGVSIAGTSDVRWFSYSALIITVGSSPRRPKIASDMDALSFLIHTTNDAIALRARLDAAGDDAPVAVLGAGFVGTEVASLLVENGREVALIARGHRPLSAALGDRISEQLVAHHHNSLDARFGVNVVKIERKGGYAVITLDDGAQLEIAAIVVAHGTHPATNWLGPQHRGGLRVDDRLRARIGTTTYAAGSGALVPVTSGQHMRLDHWDAAVEQGTHAARTLLHDQVRGSDPGAYRPTSGWSLRLHGQTVSGYGVAPTHSVQHTTADGQALLTEFLDPGTNELVGVVGLNSATAVLAARVRLL